MIRPRFPTILALALAGLTVSLAPLSGAAQQRAVGGQQGVMPRTLDGRPDLPG